MRALSGGVCPGPMNEIFIFSLTFTASRPLFALSLPLSPCLPPSFSILSPLSPLVDGRQRFLPFCFFRILCLRKLQIRP